MNCTLKKEEQAVFALRGLYEGYGYSPYKMSKFEEYDLYVRNKDFLISDGVITFTDTDGKLMALKPDVTLSIIKNSGNQPGCVRKVYYNENVYRVSEDAHCFKEILQTGLECMGAIDDATLYEVLRLAAASLTLVGKRAVLDIAHRGVVEDLLTPLCPTEEMLVAVYRCIREKNRHELRGVCNQYGVPAATADLLEQVVAIYGKPADALPRLTALLGDTQPLKQLKKLTDAFAGTEYADMLRVDFSVVASGRYYNGIVFKGFVNGVPDSVLSGGQYDQLMRQMNQPGGAVGFAVYLDRLSGNDTAAYDVDTLLLYDEDADLTALQAAADALRAEGSVMLQKEIPDKLTYGRLCRFEKGEVKPQ